MKSKQSILFVILVILATACNKNIGIAENATEDKAAPLSVQEQSQSSPQPPQVGGKDSQQIVSGVDKNETNPAATNGFVSQGGLTWMPVNTSTKTWSDANDYCSNTTINGQVGWRLPTKGELWTLYDSGAMKDRGDARYYTWSSTPNGSGAHYLVNLTYGGIDSYADTSDSNMTCVR